MHLNTHYADKESVSDLIDGGDMSAAWTDVGWQNENYRKCPCTILQEVRIASTAQNLKELFEQCENCAEYLTSLKIWCWMICYNTRSWDDNYKGVETIPQEH